MSDLVKLADPRSVRPSTTEMPAELHYYGAQGRAQPIRYTMCEGGIEWDDACAPFPAPDDVKAKWLELGKNTTTNVPMLVMDGRAYTQSSAVLRLVARKGGLMPTDIGQQYEVDNLLAAVEDYRTAAYRVILGVLGGAPDAAKIVHLKEVVLPQHFANLERLLGADDYFVANTLSVAQRVLLRLAGMRGVGPGLLCTPREASQLLRS